LNLKAQARTLIEGLKGRMAPSPYDIAWMARVTDSTGNGMRWPYLIDWLIAHQWSDGSWGGAIRYYHDRILCTLTVIIALRDNGEAPAVKEAIARGEKYIWQNLHRLRHDPFELVGFELILPTLLIEALALGLDIPKHTCGYGKIRREKLDLIPPALLYSPKITTVHSLEFLGKDSDPEQMREAIAANGSLGNSPATTCYYLLRGGDDDRALTYLQNMVTHNRNIIYLYPCRTFELTWVLHSLSFCNKPLTDLADTSIWQELRGNLGKKGIGLDPTFGIEDGDITSVTLRLLTMAGYSADPTILSRFEVQEKGIFRTYDYERNPSIGTNVHAMEALSLLPDYPNREKTRDCILAFLMANRIFDTYWVDKWHASPYYATAHVLVGIAKSAPGMLSECLSTVEWLAHTQRGDGSWGFFDCGTVEETAYALIALLYCSQLFSINRDLLQRSVAYLYRETGGKFDDYRYPPLWIGKPLYIPHDIVQASVLSALILYEETFGPL
jgi:halimadienyl-diphosphate synthase